MPTQTIRRTWKVDGVLTDVTSAVLSDLTGAYGVRRNDTLEVVVAADTAMTRLSEGVYEYSFAAVDGVAYTGWVKFVYSGTTYHFEHDIPAAGVVAAEALGVNYNLLREEIAGYLGFGRASSGWDTEDEDRISTALSQGLRQFYWPPGLPVAHDPRKPKPPDIVRPHEWSFLRQAGTLSLTSGTATYALPTNFNLMVGRLTGVGLRPIPLIDEDDMRAKLSTEPPNAKPLYAAIADMSFDATAGSRKQLVFVPTPNAAFTVAYRYSIVPEKIDSTNIYPLGGVEHGETILQSCLAAAELRLHDAAGPHYQRFMERLQASVRLDMGGGQ